MSQEREKWYCVEEWGDCNMNLGILGIKKIPKDNVLWDFQLSKNNEQSIYFLKV